MKKKHVIIILLINILIRIPRILSPQGQDGFYLIWEAKLLLQGSYFQNGANLAYLLGLYPFSGYPFGSIAIMSFFLLITGSNIFASILVYDFIFVIIFVLGIINLSKEIELEPPQRKIFVLLSTLIPNILIFSYNTSSTRLIYLAILPFFLANLLKWNKTKKIKYNLFSLLLIIVQLFIHRMAMLLIIIYIVSCIIFVFQFYLKGRKEKALTKKESRTKLQDKSEALGKIVKYTKSRYWIFLTLITYLVSFATIAGNWIGEFDLTELINIPDYFPFSLLQSLFDLFFNYGTVLLIVVFTLIFLLFPKYGRILTKINQNKSFHLLFLYIIPLFTIQIVYSIYHTVFIVSIISSYFLVALSKNHVRASGYINIVISIVILIFVWLYNIFVRSISPHNIMVTVLTGLIISTSILMLSFPLSKVQEVLKKVKGIKIEKILLTLLLIQTIYFSVFLVDRHTIYSKNQANTDNFVSEDEIIISDFLVANGTGFFASHDSLLSIRIAAHSGWFPLQDWHNVGIFLNNATGIQTYSDTCQIESIFKWYNRDIFDCSTLDSRNIFDDLIRNDANSTISRSIIQDFQIKFFISNKNSNFSIVYSEYFESNFIVSLYESIPLVLDTGRFLVWDLTVIH